MFCQRVILRAQKEVDRSIRTVIQLWLVGVEFPVAQEHLQSSKGGNEIVKRTGIRYRCFAAAAAVMSLMVFAMPILAQQDEFLAGRIAGEQAGRANVNGTLWLGAGCVSGFLGTGTGGIIPLLIAYIYEPSPPTTQLLGKSPEYVAAYTDAYKAASKKGQSSKALTGCVIGTVAVFALLAAAVAADDSSF